MEPTVDYFGSFGSNCCRILTSRLTLCLVGTLTCSNQGARVIPLDECISGVRSIGLTVDRYYTSIDILGLSRGCLQTLDSPVDSSDWSLKAALSSYQDHFKSIQDYFKYIQVYKSTSCLLMFLLHSSRLLLLLLQGLRLQQGSLQGLFQDPMDLHLQGHQFHRLLAALLQELLQGPLVLLHRVLQDLGLLHRQVLHQLDLTLVAELELLVDPLLCPTLHLDPSLDLQGGPPEACSLTPGDSLAHFPVQGSTFPATF